MLLNARIVRHQREAWNVLKAIAEIGNIFAANLVLLGNLLKLLAQDCRLKSSNAVIGSQRVVVKPTSIPLPPLIAVAPALLRNFSRAAQDHSALSSGDQLERLEAERGHVAPSTDRCSAPARTVGMGRVFQQLHTAAPGQSLEGVHLCRTSAKVHNHDGSRARRYRS